MQCLSSVCLLTCHSPTRIWIHHPVLQFLYPFFICNIHMTPHTGSWLFPKYIFWPTFGCKPQNMFLPHFSFFLFFLIVMQKHDKNHISTSTWSAQHPNAIWIIQPRVVVLRRVFGTHQLSKILSNHVEVRLQSKNSKKFTGNLSTSSFPKSL